MKEKTKEQLELELAILNHEKESRNDYDKSYAVKQVEKIVYGIIWVILLAVIAAVIKLVIIK